MPTNRSVMAGYLITKGLEREAAMRLAEDRTEETWDTTKAAIHPRSSQSSCSSNSKQHRFECDARISFDCPTSLVRA